MRTVAGHTHDARFEPLRLACIADGGDDVGGVGACLLDGKNFLLLKLSLRSRLYKYAAICQSHSPLDISWRYA